MIVKRPPVAPFVFYGAPISNGTELRFLARVRRHLKAEGVAAVILANFHLGPKKRQIDFVIATARQCVAVELKGYRRPVSGTENGDWKMTVGSVVHSVGFPYDQALSNRFAVSDALKEKIAPIGDPRGSVSGLLCVAIAARDFDGQLLPLLKVAISRATNIPFNTLMRSAQKTGRTVLVCVDALNECPLGRRPELLAALQTIIIRFGVTVLLTDQELPDLPSSLRGQVFRLVQPDKGRCRRLVETHAGRPLAENEASILEVVGSAQDASILAETLNRSVNVDGRFQLYHAFTMGRLADVPNKTLLHAALGELAARMREGYTTKIAQNTAARYLESSAKTDGIAQSLLGEAERAALLVNDQGAVRFRHDLIADFFASDHLLRTAGNARDLTRLIERPINAELREFVLGSATLTSETMTLLDGDIGNAVIDAALIGRCGAAVLRTMQDRCLDVIDRIEVAYCQLVFALPLDGQELPNRSEFVFPAQFDLSVNEQRAAASLSTAVFTNLYAPLMKMLGRHCG